MKQKRVLIVDTFGSGGQEKQFPEDNEVVVLSSIAEGYAAVQPTYDWEEARKVCGPRPLTPAVQAPIVRWMDRLHTELMKRQHPYWDAVLSDLCDADDNTPAGLGIAVIAAIAGVRYVSLAARVPHTNELFPGRCEHAGLIKSLWPMSHPKYFVIPLGRTDIHIDGHVFSREYNWARSLENCILRAEGDATGISGIITCGHSVEQQEDIVEKIWPGLTKSER